MLLLGPALLRAVAAHDVGLIGLHLAPGTQGMHPFLGAPRGRLQIDTRLHQVQTRAQAHALGISSVPTFIIDGRWAVSGAQPPEAFANALRQIAAEQAAGQGVQGAPDGSDDACGADGCKV